MKREDILSMQPGRELDMEVTRILPNWSVYDDLFQGEFRYRDHDGSTLYRENEWRPSEDISASWEVIEKIKHDYYVNIQTRYINGDANGWDVLIGREESDADTLPEAICKAALLAAIDPTEST